jgi:hypothetical protein
MSRVHSYLTFIFQTISQKKLNAIEIVVMLIFCIAMFCSNLILVEFQPDETFWIVTSPRLDEFVKGNFSAAIWDESFDSYEVRPTPSYIVAIGQRLAGVMPKDLPIRYWHWSLSREENIAKGAMPSDEVLYYSRVPMAILSAMSMLMMTIFIARAHSRIAAYIFYWAGFNEYFFIHLRRALSEPPLLFFTILAMFLTVKLLRAIQMKEIYRILGWSISIGIISGFAGQSKLTGLACGISAMVASMLVFYKENILFQRTSARQYQAIIILISVTMMTTFFILHPFFFQETARRVLSTFYVRNLVLQDQLAVYHTQVIAPGHRLNVLLKRVFIYPIHVGTENGMNRLLPFVNLSIAVYGICVAIRGIMKNGKNCKVYISLITTSVICAAPMLMTPLDWDRYYLLPIFFTCAFFSIGIAQIGIRLVRYHMINNVCLETF